MSQMRSYGAARALYSFLGFLAWCVIILGVVIAFGGATAGNQLGSFGRNTSGMAMLMGAAPGLVIGFIGFLGLAVVQNGRAAVDTAEYTQQMLQIARDQLDVSRQTLKQKWGAPAAGFGEFVEREQQAPAVAQDGAPTGSFAHRPAGSGAAGSVEISKYMGQTIEHRNGKFIWNGTAFDSLQDAKFHLDRQASLASSGPSEPSISMRKLGGAQRDA